MKSTTANVFHTVLLLLQGLNIASIKGIVTSILPPDYAELFIMVLAFLQAVVGWVQHRYNVDGTPQAAPYIPPK